jgi:hypothetical protein
MTLDVQKFTQLYARLCKIDFTGTVAGVRPNISTAPALKKAIAKGAPILPLLYRQQYVDPLTAGLPALLAQLQQAVADGQLTPQGRLSQLEPFYAPIYEHAAKVAPVDVRPQLNRFLAVVSNLFRSFVNSNKRTSVNVPIVTMTPPLAFFQTDSGQGPYTITSESMLADFNTPVGIVSLPATYRNDPVLWASLTHEVCGHDVVHADPQLVPELVAEVRALFTDSFNPHEDLSPETLNGLLWSYWIDEAVADAYGVLNMGPTFPLNLAAFFAALSAVFGNKLAQRPIPARPQLSTSAGPRDPRNGDNNMDEHPIDILRLYLAIGVIDSMSNLSAAKRADYIADIEAVADLTADGATTVEMAGMVEISHTDFIPVNTSMPLADAAQAARAVGNLIATKKFEALNGHSIQDVETWDDPDEMAAAGIASKIAAGQSIVASGDDAQLLAGATMALVANPGLYDSATSLLNAALDDSFKRDPIWGDAQPDSMFAPSRFYRPEKVVAKARR